MTFTPPSFCLVQHPIILKEFIWSFFNCRSADNECFIFVRMCLSFSFVLEDVPSGYRIPGGTESPAVTGCDHVQGHPLPPMDLESVSFPSLGTWCPPIDLGICGIL